MQRSLSWDPLPIRVHPRSTSFSTVATVDAGSLLRNELGSLANGRREEESWGRALPSALPQLTLTLTVPEYSNKRVSRPVQVYFYVSNGRRKRSPTQSFKFLPGTFWHSPCGGLAGIVES